MTTYNKGYYWNPARRKKQRYALMERVVDFSKTPVSDTVGSVSWAAGDVLEAIPIKAGQTVLGVQVEIMKVSGTAKAKVRIGYGGAPDYWGAYSLGKARTDPTGFVGLGNGLATPTTGIAGWVQPVYFSSADTVDLKLTKAITDGKVRVIVHLLEDDR